jgi:hypothetical protein
MSSAKVDSFTGDPVGLLRTTTDSPALSVLIFDLEVRDSTERQPVMAT